MSEEIAAIEAALETEQHMMARQRRLKQRWKLKQATANVEKDPPSRSLAKDRSKQNACNAA